MVVFSIIFVHFFIFSLPYYWVIQRWKLPLLSPVSFIYLISAVFLSLKAYLGPIVVLENYDGYIFGLTVEITYWIVQLLTALLLSRYRFKINFIKFRTFPIRSIHFGSMQIYLLLVIFVIFLLVSSKFGFLNWISDPRTGYQFYRDGLGLFYAIFSNLICFLSFALMYRKKNIPLMFISCIFVMYLGYLTGSKGVILNILVIVLFLLYGHSKRLFMNVAVVGSIGVLILIFMSFKSAFSGALTVANFLSYFDAYYNSARWYELYLDGQANLYYGKIVFSNLYAMVPSIIFPDKPDIYGILHINEIFYPGMAELGFTPAFDSQLLNFVDFGFLGIIIFGIFSLKAVILSRVVRINFYAKELTAYEFLIIAYFFFPGMFYFAHGVFLIILLVSYLIFMHLSRWRLKV